MRLINVNAQRVEEHQDGSYVLVQGPDMPVVKADNIHDFIIALREHDEAVKLAAKRAMYGDDWED